MSCVTSTRILILFNGGNLDPFIPTRGLRQGDLISPYLFILCMEFLGHLIKLKCVVGDWKPLKASHGNIGITHLFFADDLILFAKIEENTCEVISEVLNRFCKESDQKVSLEKSRIYFSPNVQEGVKEEICSNLGIQATTNISKYLGFPIKHKGAARNRVNFVVERVLNKLSGWKAKFLSFAGRSVLVKSVMSAIPNYVMQGEALPMHLCEKLDKINRDFLWGSTRDKKKLHLVGWNKIIQPKEEGGLGIQAVRAKSVALLAKLNWRMYQEKDSFWAKVILNKYCSLDRRRARDPYKLPGSSSWTAIKVGFPIFEKGIGWSVGDGKKIIVWSGCWIRDVSLRDLIVGPLTQNESELLHSDFLIEQG